MSDVQFDISLKNSGSNTQGLTLFSKTASSQSLSKYSFVTPYSASYLTGTIFTYLDNSNTYTFTLSADKTMAEVIVLLNALGVGTWIIAYNDSTNGNVFYIITSSVPETLSIDYTTPYSWVSVRAATMHSYNDITFPDSNTVLVSNSAAAVAGNAAIQRSANNGVSWSAAALPSSTNYFVFQMSFYDANNGFVVGCTAAGTSRIWKTTNGGTSWSTVGGSIASWRYGAIKMFNALNGVAYRRSTANVNQIVVTTDGGASWSLVQALGTWIGDYYGDGYLQFLDVSNGFFFPSGQTTNMWVTADGGGTWSAVVLPFAGAGFYPRGGYALDTNNIWIVGEAGMVRYTNDGGATWFNWDISTAQPIITVHAFSITDVMVGRQGTVVSRTTNGGSIWTDTTIAVGGTAMRIKFRSLSLGFGINCSTTVYKYS
jgi:photosystem II stability/assembly factor-like uncharacterized protein